MAPPVAITPVQRWSMVGVVAGIALISSLMSAARLRSGSSGLLSPSGVPLPFVAPEDRVTMDISDAGPAVAMVDRDTIEDVVCRFSVYANSKSRLYVAAFSGADFRPLWRIGPLGELGAESTATHVGVVQKTVLIADSQAILHIYDLATGAEKKMVRLSDRASFIYPATNGANEAWIRMSDEKHVLFDVASSTLKAHGEPSWMPKPLEFPDSFDCQLHFRNPAARARCVPKNAVPQFPMFEAQNALVEGQDAVALGEKSPGTRTPMLAGFDGTTKAPRWKAQVASDALGLQEGSPAVADLVAGRLVVAYQTTKSEGHVAALDGRSGRPLWDVALGKTFTSPSLLAVSPNRVYVPASPVLLVYDARSGRKLGTIGTPN